MAYISVHFVLLPKVLGFNKVLKMWIPSKLRSTDIMAQGAFKDALYLEGRTLR